MPRAVRARIRREYSVYFRGWSTPPHLVTRVSAAAWYRSNHSGSASASHRAKAKADQSEPAAGSVSSRKSALSRAKAGEEFVAYFRDKLLINMDGFEFKYREFVMPK